MLNLGDAVVTGFSGTVTFGPGKGRSADQTPIDRTFIASGQPSARIFSPRAPGFVWDGRYWNAPRTHDIPARTVGQVFGVAIDDLDYPDIYLAATSLYGLNIVVPPPADAAPTDRLPWRAKTGSKAAQWMSGQFGNGGGPGTIWKIDGRSGRIVHFADVTLHGDATGPASLGAIAYDAAHKQLFVSDLSTGMIERIGLNGQRRGEFDHGVTARTAAHLAPIAYDRSQRADIHDPHFNAENPATWGFAAASRRVFGLAVHGERLYYAVADGQIWSVRLGQYGEFTTDARWEITLPDAGKAPPVSSIAFTHDGTMIVAERAIVGTTYDYRALPASGVAHVYRFHRETPKNPNTPSEWYQQPEEYAVGYAGDNRNSAGGVALGYGYNSDGTIDFTACEDALFFTGDMLRGFHELEDAFAPEGPLQLYGLQVSPSASVRGFNTPPAVSYFANFGDRMSSADARGTVGDVAVYRVDCKQPGCKLPPEGSPLTALPPAATKFAGGVPPVVPPGGGGGTNGGGGGGGGCVPGSAGCSPACVPGTPGCSPACIPGTPGCGSPCIPGAPGCGSGCIPGMPGCTNPCLTLDCCGVPGCTHTAAVCMAVEAQPVCDTTTGRWTVQLNTTDQAGVGIDTLNVYSATGGVSVTNGPIVPTTPGVIDLSGGSGGQNVTLNVCGYNSAAKMSGQPYDCCRQIVHVRIPRTVCTAVSTQGGH